CRAPRSDCPVHRKDPNCQGRLPDRIGAPIGCEQASDQPLRRERLPNSGDCTTPGDSGRDWDKDACDLERLTGGIGIAPKPFVRESNAYWYVAAALTTSRALIWARTAAGESGSAVRTMATESQ